MTRNRLNGRLAIGSANHLYGGLNLRGDAPPANPVLCADPIAEEVFDDRDLLSNLAGLCKDVLNIVDSLPRQEIHERLCPVVKQVRAVVQYGRSTNFSEPNDH